MTKPVSAALALIAFLLGVPAAPAAGAPEPFTAWRPAPDAAPARIVLQHDPDAGTGADWSKADSLQWHSSGSDVTMIRAAQHLREGIAKMTGQTPEVASTSDLSRGIVLTTLDAASPALQDDPDVRAALKNTGEDAYNHREAFFIRSESDRVLLIANTPAGLAAAAVELLESVEYEVLGMGPNWIHVPDYNDRPLVFDLERADRPSYYLRNLWATSGQQRGVGTLETVEDPDDEPVNLSYRRWQVGTRMFGRSMPGFPGHAMQGYHSAVAARMVETNTSEGFLVAECAIGSDDERPAPSEDNAGTLWLSTERDERGEVRAFISDGETWVKQNPRSYRANLDLSVPLVREVIFEAMKQRAEKHFAENPDDVFIFGTDPEDGGGYYTFAEHLRYPQWYPKYREAEGDPLGDPYVLHEFKELDQPQEMWDPAAPGDTVFAFNNWLLREYDQWIESQPESQRVTATGQSKKDLVRCSLYCYNFHDVPPNFNLDERIRVMIAGYPKHRGRGKWEAFATQLDMAQAYQVMLPREPSGTYRIISLAYYWDRSPAGLAPRWSAAPADLVEDYGSTYDAGIKAMSIETDFNFGRFGLGYYLITKTLWDADITAQELDTIRDRWLQRAFGSGWREMKQYYDYRLVDNYPVNAPNTWARAIRMIDAADAKIDPASEPAAQRRLDDLKQYWYYHYLIQSGQGESDSSAMREFVWKGQMSYMVAMHAVTRRIFGTSNVREAAGSEYAQGPAHYTHEETQRWWKEVLDHWQLTPVTQFDERTLANGQPAGQVDLMDLVRVREFQGGPSDAPFYSNSYDIPSITVATVATQPNERIGFKMFWPFAPERGEAYEARDLSYGMDRWNPETRQWEQLIDKTTTAEPSVKARQPDGQPVQYVRVREPAPSPGLYRFDIGRGGRLAKLTSLGYDLGRGEYRRILPFTYLDVKRGHTQSPVFFYIPKGTESLDFEADNDNRKTLVLYTGLPAEGMSESRQVDVSAMGTHTIELEPGEVGTVAELRSNGFAFPYMYSVYSHWAKSPAALLVPRDVAEADGLTILE